MAADVFGQAGADSVFQIMEVLWKLFRQIEPERLSGSLIVYRHVGAVTVDRNEAIMDFAVLSERTNGFAVEIDDQGSAYLRNLDDTQVEELSKSAVVYVYYDGNESFFAGDAKQPVLRLVPTALSQFSIPTFRTLRDALENYAIEAIRYSSCPIFSPAWKDPNRLFFKVKPERFMRRSLEWFLHARLGGDYEVRPEQIMDETHPVDIKVTHTFSNRRGIIEIKWLGDSLNDTGEITVQYRDSRARDGAQQLADYLDQNAQRAPLHITQGYYVIIDARRQGLTSTKTEVSATEGLHYKDVEIQFDPHFEEIRWDFDRPFRMFAEPKLSPN